MYSPSLELGIAFEIPQQPAPVSPFLRYVTGTCLFPYFFPYCLFLFGLFIIFIMLLLCLNLLVATLSQRLVCLFLQDILPTRYCSFGSQPALDHMSDCAKWRADFDPMAMARSNSAAGFAMALVDKATLRLSPCSSSSGMCIL